MTHGDLLIKNYDGEGLEYWMHAYSDGHTSCLYDDLKSLPEWLAKRSKLEYLLRKDDAIKKLKKDCGSLGPWQLEVLLDEDDISRQEDDLEDDLEKRFRKSWESYLGVNLDYCGAERISSLMTLRHFDRWTAIDKKDAPWSNGEPDITVVCNDKDRTYRIIPNKECLDTPEIEIEFGECLYEEFKKEYLNESHRRG